MLSDASIQSVVPSRVDDGRDPMQSGRIPKESRKARIPNPATIAVAAQAPSHL